MICMINHKIRFFDVTTEFSSRGEYVSGMIDGLSATDRPIGLIL